MVALAPKEDAQQVLIGVDKLGLSIPVNTVDTARLLGNPMNYIKSSYTKRGKRPVRQILSDISFSLHAGERIAITGGNGAGKSTLLRIIVGTYKSYSGTLNVNGQISSLLDMNFGLNLAATGIENVLLRGVQMGLTLNEVRAVLPDVIEFADIGDAVFDPVSTYSTGMRLRLTVGLVTAIKPDILVLDEWIGSGDAAFKSKVEARMTSLITQSRGMLIASHARSIIESICTKEIVLENGRIKEIIELQ